MNLLFPPTCVLCDEKSDQRRDLCSACAEDLPWLGQGCQCCALPLSTSLSQIYCALCQIEKPPFDKTFALFQYQKPIDHLITAFKFQQNFVYGRLLSSLMLERLQKFYENKPWPEVIIPVPLHIKRLQERGFNQALELAKPLGKALKIEVDFKSCQRIRFTKAQTELKKEERKQNVQNAFEIEKDFSAKHVAVIDDVITTGNTMTSISTTLQKVGVRKIDVWCCARTTND